MEVLISSLFIYSYILNERGIFMQQTSRFGTVTAKKGLFYQVWKARYWYLFVLPAVIFFLIFRYYPLYFIQIAFKEFRITRALTDSPFVGMYYFKELFNSPGFWTAFANTIIINIYKLIVCFPAPIIVAILINEIRNRLFKRSVQTILYLPHFVSWIVVASIITNFLSVNGGVVNNIMNLFGMEPVMFLGKKEYFRGILVLSELWKEVGYGAIVYLSALTAIDPQLYDSADIDGAGWFQKIVYITIVGIKEIIIVMLIIRVGSMLGGNFDQVQSLLNKQVLSVGDTLDTYVFRVGISLNRYSFATAAGLFNTVIAAGMLFTADRFAKRIGERGIF